MKSFIKVLSLFFGIFFILGLLFIGINQIKAAGLGDPCNPDDRCTEGECYGYDEEFHIDGICRSEGEGGCNNIGDCEEGEECIDGNCVATGGPGTCSSDADCGSGEICQRGDCMSGSRDDIGDSDVGEDCSSDSDCMSGLVCTNGSCQSGGQRSSRSDYGLSNVPDQLRNIGDGDLATVVVRIIQYVVGFVGILLLIMFIYGGIMYMTAAGNEEQAGKAKKVLTYAVIGIVIVAFSFVIAEFIVRALSGNNTSNTNTNVNTNLNVSTN